VLGHVDRHAGPNRSSNKINWAFASATTSEMVSNRTHHKGRKGETVAASRASYAHYGAGLRRTHIRRRAAEIFTRRREDVNDLRVLGEQTFVLDVAGITATSPPTIDRLSFLTRKIHPAIEHPNNLLVGMLVRSGMYTRLHFPPHDHALFKDTPLNFIGDALPRQSRERAEARHYRHYIPRFFFGARLINF
jgi:hypothetical protein